VTIEENAVMEGSCTPVLSSSLSQLNTRLRAFALISYSVPSVSSCEKSLSCEPER
jgi:hypothetical protein